MEQHPDGDSDGLHVSVRSFALHLSLSSLYVVNDGLLDDRNFKVVALLVPNRGQTCDFVKLDCEVTHINCIIYHVP